MDNKWVKTDKDTVEAICQYSTMNATMDTFFSKLVEGIERNARSVVFDHLLSGSLPDHLIDNFKHLLCYGNTQMARWVSLEEQIRLHHELQNGSRSVVELNINGTPTYLIPSIVIKNPDAKRLSFL